jgi:tetratricopeptide (TPR) repeat protein
MWAAILMMAGVVSTQEVSPASERTLIPANTLPERVLMSGFDMIWQDPNRCSAAALTIQMSYFRNGLDYYDTIRDLNPHEEDMSVRLDEMIAEAETHGLKGIERMGGTIDMLRLLVANGFPVLIENVYYDGGDVMRDWMSHNRVIIGYDDALGIFYSFDSLRGNGEGEGLTFEYSFIEERWRPMNRVYLVLYEPEDEAFLQEVMGEHWDPQFNAEWTLQQVQADLNGPAPDSFDSFNLGSTLVALERYEEAATAFDTARAIGLPWRMLWYQFGPFEAYLQVGRYQDVYALTRSVIADAPGVEEMYYYIARAYAADGNTERAIANLEAALWRNGNFRDAAVLLAELRGETGSS